MRGPSTTRTGTWGLAHHSLINSEETKKRYRELLSVVKTEYEDIAKSEVQGHA